MLMPSKVFSQNSEVRLPRNIPREDRAGGRRGGNGSSGLVGSKLDLITFLEQLSNPRTIRRMEATAIFPGSESRKKEGDRTHIVVYNITTEVTPARVC